jgi:hypothetical protein
MPRLPESLSPLVRALRAIDTSAEYVPAPVPRERGQAHGVEWSGPEPREAVTLNDPRRASARSRSRVGVPTIGPAD